MALKASITYVGGPDVLAKDLRAAAKEALAVVGDQWHKDTLPGHFAPAAAGKYKYRARTAKYKARKRKAVGHNIPLVFDGDMKRQVGRMARITSTSKGAKVTMTGPRYLYKYKKPGQPDKAAELTATTYQEADAMARRLDTLMTDRLNANKTTRTVKIG